MGRDLLPLGECWYWGQVKEKLEAQGRSYAEWKRMGGDPPCVCNNYNQWSDQRDRHMTWAFLFIFLGIPVLVLLLAWLFP